MMRCCTILLFLLACTERLPSVEDTGSFLETESQDTGESDTEGSDSGQKGGSDGIHNIAPSEGSGGQWSAGQEGTTPLGATIRIPSTYAPKTLASPVIWLFNESLTEWKHTEQDSAIVVSVNEYNDWQAIYDKLNETMALLEEGYNVDRGRYYFAGWSAGGNIAVIVASANQDLIAGTMVFPGTGGGMAQPYMAEQESPKLRLFYACGDQDPNFDWRLVEQESQYWSSAYGYTTRFEKVMGAPHRIDEDTFGIRAIAWDWMQPFNLAN